jgi:hypothetical protein
MTTPTPTAIRLVAASTWLYPALRSSIVRRDPICPTCHGCGWICEAHPDQPWPHADASEPDGQCPGPGMPCDADGCPVSGRVEWDEMIASTREDDGHG